MQLRPRPARGLGLLDALIGLALLAVGMLALAGFQTRLVSQTTESQSRQVAMGFANELLSTAQVDPGNLPCYSLPAAGTCNSALARASTDRWGAEVAEGLPGPVTVQSVQTGTRLSVTIQWAARRSDEPFRLQVVTDVQ